jgi:hypothetical protein
MAKFRRDNRAGFLIHAEARDLIRGVRVVIRQTI